MQEAPLLEMRGIAKAFPGVQALDDVSLEARAGEVHALVGQNGAGKSTLMKVLCGASQPDRGEIVFRGRAMRIASPADARRLGVAVIFQEFSLVPYLDIAQNIFLGREFKGRVPGTIDRDRTGAPTGVLKEGAEQLVTTLIPPPTDAQWRQGILRMIDTLHSEGMTAYKDPDDTQPMWNAYRELLDAGQLTVRVCVLWHAGSTVESAQAVIKTIQALPRPPQSLGDGRLLSCGAKIYMDGTGAGRTAWVYQEWRKNKTEIDRGNFGYPAEDPMVYRQMVRALHQAGIHVGTHAVGDRAIDWVVDTYAEVLREKPTRGLRHAVIHANFPTDHAIEVMAALQRQYDAGYPEMQPPFMWWIGDNYAANLDTGRALRIEPLKTLLARGVQWTGGSDFSVTPLPARYGIWAAVERQTSAGKYGLQPFGTAEAVDAHAALRAYTAEGARQLFLEDKIGSLEPGKEADIAVWDRDLYTVPGTALKDMKCEMTLFHGKVVYERHRNQSGDRR